MVDSVLEVAESSNGSPIRPPGRARRVSDALHLAHALVELPRANSLTTLAFDLASRVTAIACLHSAVSLLTNCDGVHPRIGRIAADCASERSSFFEVRPPGAPTRAPGLLISGPSRHLLRERS